MYWEGDVATLLHDLNFWRLAPNFMPRIMSMRYPIKDSMPLSTRSLLFNIMFMGSEDYFFEQLIRK